MAEFLDSEGKSPRTRKLYTDAAAFLALEELVPAGITAWNQVTRAHIRQHQAALLKLHSRTYANNQCRALKQFWHFLHAEYGAEDIMKEVRPPTVPPQLVPVISPPR